MHYTAICYFTAYSPHGEEQILESAQRLILQDLTTRAVGTSDRARSHVSGCRASTLTIRRCAGART
jgi:hypothetical protein